MAEMTVPTDGRRRRLAPALRHLYLIEDAEAYLGVSDATLRRWKREHKIEAEYDSAGRLLFDVTSVDPAIVEHAHQINRKGVELAARAAALAAELEVALAKNRRLEQRIRRLEGRPKMTEPSSNGHRSAIPRRRAS